MSENKKVWQKTEYFVCATLLILLAGVMLFLTYQQAWHVWNGYEEYHCDALAYMQEALGMETAYSFPYPIMFWCLSLLSKVVSIEWAYAIVVTLAQVASFLLLRHFFRVYLGKKLVKTQGKELTTKQSVITTLAAFGLLFFSMIFVYNHPFPGTRFYYMGVYSPNPFHNATYLVARPFCIACIYQVAELLDTFEQQFDWKKGIAFSITLLLATMTKPSFTIVLCGAVGLVLLYRFFKNRCKTIKNTLYFGVLFIPTFADLLYQFGGVFSGMDSKGEEAGIGFGLFHVWREYCDNYLVAILLVIFFPLVVLFFQYRKLRTNTLYRLGWQMYAMGLAMFVLLYEKGFRAVDSNFSWGYMIGAFFLVMGSLLTLLEETCKGDKNVKKLLIQWGAFLLHVACGIFYFGMIITGGSYY